VRSLGRAILTIVAVLMILNQFGFNMGPLLGERRRVGLAISFVRKSRARLRHWILSPARGTSSRWATSFASAPREGTSRTSRSGSCTFATRVGRYTSFRNGQITQVTNLTRSWEGVSVDVELAWGGTPTAPSRPFVAPPRHSATILRLPTALLSPPQVTGNREDRRRCRDAAERSRASIHIAGRRGARSAQAGSSRRLDEEGIATFVAPALPVV
jgi:hypothetical protein